VLPTLAQKKMKNDQIRLYRCTLVLLMVLQIYGRVGVLDLADNFDTEMRAANPGAELFIFIPIPTSTISHSQL